LTLILWWGIIIHVDYHYIIVNKILIWNRKGLFAMSENNDKYISVYEAKELIIDIGKRMYMRGFVASNDGNISCRLSPDTIITTPTGVSKGFMTPEMLVVMNLDGTVLSAGNYKPSSEVRMHIRVYKENPEVMAVTHAHPPVATSYAIAGVELNQPILSEAVLNIGVIPIARYATPTTPDVPDSIAPFCRDYNAVLLANHGALTWGKDLIEAWYRMESLEHFATMMMYTSNIIGKTNVLSCDQVDKLIEIRKNLGVTTGGMPPCALVATNTQDILPDPNREQEDLEDLIRKVTNEVLQKLMK